VLGSNDKSTAARNDAGRPSAVGPDIGKIPESIDAGERHLSDGEIKKGFGYRHVSSGSI
jgi:hypothetical protein